MPRELHLKPILDNQSLPPLCSIFIINPGRTWQEPWRFLTYGFVHNNLGHLISNVVTQLFFGLPLELSNGWKKVALIYLSGIGFAGLVRELTSNQGTALAGSSGNSIEI